VLMQNIRSEILHNLFRSASNLMAFEQFLASLPQFLQSTDESGEVVETREPAKPQPPRAPEPSLDSVFGARSSEPQPVQTGRNDPCPCGSGRKFKACCGKASG